MGSGTPAAAGTGSAGVKGVKSGKRSTLTKAGTSAGASHKVRVRKASSTGSVVGRAGKAGRASASKAAKASRTGKGKAGLRQATAGRRPASRAGPACRCPRQAAHGDAPCALASTASQHATGDACKRCGPRPAPGDTPKGVAPQGGEALPARRRAARRACRLRPRSTQCRRRPCPAATPRATATAYSPAGRRWWRSTSRRITFCLPWRRQI